MMFASFAASDAPFPEQEVAAPEPATRLARKLDQHVPLTDRDRTAISRLVLSKTQQLDAGVPLIEAGDAMPDIQVILTGWAARITPAANGRGQITAFYLPGDICDFSAVTLPRVDSSIVALTPLRVGGISRTALRDFTLAHPRLSQSLLWESASSASIQREWMVRICQFNARQRIAGLICELAARLYVVDLADDSGFELPLTQSEIGGACGLTTEHTNRTLRELREARIMRIDRGRLWFDNWDELQALARFQGGYLHFRSLQEAR